MQKQDIKNWAIGDVKLKWEKGGPLPAAGKKKGVGGIVEKKMAFPGGYRKLTSHLETN